MSSISRRRDRKPLGFEQLESRRVLASLVYQNPNGGFWNNADDWNLKRVPGPGMMLRYLPLPAAQRSSSAQAHRSGALPPMNRFESWEERYSLNAFIR